MSILQIKRRRRRRKFQEKRSRDAKRRIRPRPGNAGFLPALPEKFNAARDDVIRPLTKIRASSCGKSKSHRREAWSEFFSVGCSVTALVQCDSAIRHAAMTRDNTSPPKPRRDLSATRQRRLMSFPLRHRYQFAFIAERITTNGHVRIDRRVWL